MNSHATSNTHGGYDTCHRIDEIHPAKKATEVSDSDSSRTTLHDFVICSFPRNSNLSGSPSTTRSKT
jgi:hypothetical protein